MSKFPHNSKIKVLVVQRFFPIYQKPVFDRLNEVYDFHLLHSKVPIDLNKAKANYAIKVSSLYLPKRFGKIFLFTLVPIIRYRPDIIIHESTLSILSISLTWIYSRIFSSKFVIRGHGVNRTKGFNPKKLLDSKLRLFYMKMADAYLFYGVKAKDHLSNYLNPKKLFVAKNTLDTNKLSKIFKELNSEGISSVKKRLKFNSRYNISYIGRLIDGKYPTMLFDIFVSLPESIRNDTTIHVIGDGPLRNELENNHIYIKNKQNFKFYGSIYDDKLNGEFLFASDLFLMPGEVGLSVNHAFAFACPVFTFDKGEQGPYHGPEFEYIQDGETGFVAKYLDIKDMSDKIKFYLSDNDLQLRIKANALNKIYGELTMDNMIKGYAGCVNYLLKLK